MSPTSSDFIRMKKIFAGWHRKQEVRCKTCEHYFIGTHNGVKFERCGLLSKSFDDKDAWTDENHVCTMWKEKVEK